VSSAFDWEERRALWEELASNLVGNRFERPEILEKNETAYNTLELPKARRRGPSADMNLHRAMAQIVRPYGPTWRDESNLKEIAEQLDRKDNRPLIPPSKQWAKRKPAALSWSRAVRHWPKLVVHKIEYSLKMANRDSLPRNLTKTRWVFLKNPAETQRVTEAKPKR
jgi:hypothetical protein